MIRLAFILLFLTSCTTAHRNLNRNNKDFRTPASDESTIESCGQHPYQQDNPSGESVKFKPVRVGKHGFIVQRIWSEGSGDSAKFFATATHFSAAFPRHLFSAMVKFRLDVNEYEALEKAFEEHPGNSPKARFAPFIVLSRQPMIPGQNSPNNTFGFCMKDFERILNGERQSLYGGKKNVIYGNIRKWNPKIPGVFAPYKLDGDSPVIEIALGNGSVAENGETFGDVTKIFFHPHRPMRSDFVNESDSNKFWLLSEPAPQ